MTKEERQERKLRLKEKMMRMLENRKAIIEEINGCYVVQIIDGYDVSDCKSYHKKGNALRFVEKHNVREENIIYK